MVNIWPWSTLRRLRAECTDAQHRMLVAEVTVRLQTKTIERLEADLSEARSDLRRLRDRTMFAAQNTKQPAAFNADPFAEVPNQAPVFVDQPGATAADIADHIANAFAVHGS